MVQLTVAPHPHARQAQAKKEHTSLQSAKSDSETEASQRKSHQTQRLREQSRHRNSLQSPVQSRRYKTTLLRVTAYMKIALPSPDARNITTQNFRKVQQEERRKYGVKSAAHSTRRAKKLPAATVKSNQRDIPARQRRRSRETKHTANSPTNRKGIPR